MQSRFNTQFFASSLESITAIMVFTMLSRALLLVSLLSLCTQSLDGDLDDLAEIIKLFHDNFRGGQYAAAINAPKKSLSLLKEANEAREHFQACSTYKGNDLIVAKPFGERHSEDLLMNPPNQSHLTHLLDKKGSDRRLIFYTLISPCIDWCLSNKIERINYSILPGLDVLKAYRGIKAFAFTHIYRFDQNREDLRAELGKVAERVPLYRCLYKCILCGTPGSNTPIKEECTWETDKFKTYIKELPNYIPSTSG